MPSTPIAQSMLDLLSHISPPGAESAALADLGKPIVQKVDGAHAVLDGLLEEVEKDLRASRSLAAGTALGLAGTHLSLDASRGVAPPRRVEWLAAHMRTAAKEMTEGHFGEALQAVRLARLALRH
jgi:hypothetical protein